MDFVAKFKFKSKFNLFFIIWKDGHVGQKQKHTKT